MGGSSLVGDENVTSALDQSNSLSAVERNVASIGSILGYSSDFVGRKMVQTFPSRPVNGESMIIVFDANGTALQGENEVFLQFGYDGWQVRICLLKIWLYCPYMLVCRAECLKSRNDSMSRL